MIEITIWWTASGGDGASKYLIAVPTDSDLRIGTYFKALPTISAIRRAFTEFERDHTDWRPTRVDVRDTPDKVLQP